MNYFSWHHALRNSTLESSTKLVCYTIGTHFAMDGTGSFPSYETIAAESGLSRSTTILHVSKAVEAGFLKVVKRKINKDGKMVDTSNLYSPCFPSTPVGSGEGPFTGPTLPTGVRLPDPPSPVTGPGGVQPSDPNYPSDLPKEESTPVVPKGTGEKFEVAEVKPDQPDRFDFFWEKYPRKIGKPAALRAWKKLETNDELARAIITGLNRWKKSPQWGKDATGEFIPHPSTFLNQRRWEDNPKADLSDVAKSSGSERTKQAQDAMERIARDAYNLPPAEPDFEKMKTVGDDK